MKVRMTLGDTGQRLSVHTDERASTASVIFTYADGHEEQRPTPLINDNSISFVLDDPNVKHFELFVVFPDFETTLVQNIEFEILAAGNEHLMKQGKSDLIGLISHHQMKEADYESSLEHKEERILKLTAEMKELLSINEGDPDTTHGIADKLMIKILRDEGYDEAMNYYERMTRHTA